MQHDIIIIVGREVTFITSLIRPEYFGCHRPPKLLPVTNYHGLCFPSEYIPPFGSIRIQCLHVLVHSFWSHCYWPNHFTKQRRAVSCGQWFGCSVKRSWWESSHFQTESPNNPSFDKEIPGMNKSSRLPLTQLNTSTLIKGSLQKSGDSPNLFSSLNTIFMKHAGRITMLAKTPYTGFEILSLIQWKRAFSETWSLQFAVNTCLWYKHKCHQRGANFHSEVFPENVKAIHQMCEHCWLKKKYPNCSPMHYAEVEKRSQK